MILRPLRQSVIRTSRNPLLVPALILVGLAGLILGLLVMGGRLWWETKNAPRPDQILTNEFKGDQHAAVVLSAADCVRRGEGCPAFGEAKDWWLSVQAPAGVVVTRGSTSAVVRLSEQTTTRQWQQFGSEVTFRGRFVDPSPVVMAGDTPTWGAVVDGRQLTGRLVLISSGGARFQVASVTYEKGGVDR